MSTNVEAVFKGLHERSLEGGWQVREAVPQSKPTCDMSAAMASPVVNAVCEGLGVAASEQLWEAAQSWSLKQLAQTELVALSILTDLMAEMNLWDTLRTNLSDQAVDESKHLATFLELLNDFPEPGSPTWTQAFLSLSREAPDWRLKHLSLTLILETQALASLRTLKSDTSAPRAAWAARLVLSDEARHVSAGKAVALSWTSQACKAELDVAGEWVRELLHVCSRRFDEAVVLSGGESCQIRHSNFAETQLGTSLARISDALFFLGIPVLNSLE